MKSQATDGQQPAPGRAHVTSRRWTVDFAAFDKTWARGNRWAVLTMPADKLPATAEPTVWLKAAADLEEVGRKDVAQHAYRTATQRWPEQAVGWFALANSRYAGGDLRGAEAAFRESVSRQPDFAALLCLGAPIARHAIRYGNIRKGRTRRRAIINARQLRG